MDLGLDWMATVRARAGLNLNRVLLFGTGGLAIGRIASELEVFSEETFYPENITRWTRTSGSHRETNLGWTAGAGAEVLVGRRVSLRGEYLYTAIGQDSVPFADELPYHFDESVTEDSDADIDLKLHTVRAGINMRF
jgi:outer membrane immunogenic protein